MSVANDPSTASAAAGWDFVPTSNKNSSMSSANDPSTMPKSLSAIMERMKKRQADAPAESPAPKKAYNGNLRFDLKAVVVSVYNTANSERFTVIPCLEQQIDKNDRCNGYIDENIIRVRPEKEDDYNETIVLGDVFELSRYHGGKPERTPRKYRFGDSVVLKRVSIKRGNNGMNFNNVHWVEHSEEKFPMNIPKTMMDLSSDSYHKAVVIGGENSNVSNAAFAELKLTSSGKIYTRLTFNYGEENDLEGSAMVWDDRLGLFGIWNPEVLETILPKVLETSLTIIGSREKAKEGFSSDRLKLSVRALLLGAGTLQQYVQEYGESLTKKAVVKELGATVNSDLNEGHPLNSIADTTVLNISEWSGDIKSMPAAVKFYKLFDTITYAILN